MKPAVLFTIVSKGGICLEIAAPVAKVSPQKTN